jgi:hypothetical protein
VTRFPRTFAVNVPAAQAAVCSRKKSGYHFNVYEDDQYKLAENFQLVHVLPCFSARRPLSIGYASEQARSDEISLEPGENKSYYCMNGE